MRPHLREIIPEAETQAFAPRLSSQIPRIMRITIPTNSQIQFATPNVFSQSQGIQLQTSNGFVGFHVSVIVVASVKVVPLPVTVAVMPGPAVVNVVAGISTQIPDVHVLTVCVGNGTMNVPEN